MILRRIKYFFTKNPLDLLDYNELVLDKIKYEENIKNLHQRIPEIEKEIDIYWNKAKETKSPADERALAERINSLSQKRNFTLKQISDTESNLRSVEEFINKIEEKNRKSSLSPLTTGSQLELEEVLNKISVYEEEKQQLQKTLTRVSDPKNDEIDDNVNEILQALKAAKGNDDTTKIVTDKEQVSTPLKNLELEK
jgi:hypothetical protein